MENEMEDGMTAVTEEDLTEMNREELLKRALDLLEKNRTQARFILDQQSEIERLKSEKKVPQESQTDDWKICHVYGKGNRLTNRAELLINTGDAALPLSPSSAITSWSFIGSGCDGKVFKAINAVDGSVSAMKEIHIGANTPEALDAAVENFKDQARLLAKLKHKSIVEFISAVYVLPENLHESDDPSPDHNRTPARSPGTPTETPPAGAKVLDPEQFKASPLDSPAFSQARYRAILYIKMEFCNAGTLEDYFPGKSKEKLSPKECLHLFHGAAAGIAFVHGENVIHRGIKPANIFIAKADGQLQVKIGDFGLSCEADKKGLAPKWVTGGTPMYMSPEQHKEAPHGMSTDIHGLGVSMLYFFSRVSSETEFAEEWLMRMKNGETPADWDVKLQAYPESDVLLSLFKRMVHNDAAQRPSAQEVVAIVYKLWSKFGNFYFL